MGRNRGDGKKGNDIRYKEIETVNERRGTRQNVCELTWNNLDVRNSLETNHTVQGGAAQTEHSSQSSTNPQITITWLGRYRHLPVYQHS